MHIIVRLARHWSNPVAEDTSDMTHVLGAILALLAGLTRYSDAVVQDVCISEAEDLVLECGRNEIVIANHAHYGRMKRGRCLDVDFQMGCGTDILFLVDSWCSGKNKCHIDVPNKELVAANECPKGLMTYLEVDFVCQIAAPHGVSLQSCNAGRPIKLPTSHNNAIASITADQHGCGTRGAPWTVEGAPGQRVNISMLDFAYTPASSGAKASTMTCEPYGYIVERKLGINKTVCGGVARRSHVYMSATSSVEIILTRSRKSGNAFLLNYAVIGCPDARPPEHAWYKRTGDTAEMGCEWSDLSWQMKCVESRWIGRMGNCSKERTAEVASSQDSFEIHPVLSLGLIIGLAALIGLLMLIIAIGFVCVRRKRSPNDASALASPSQQHGTLVPSTMPKGQGYVLHTTGRRPTNHVQQYIPGTADGTTNSDLLHGLGTATVNRGKPNRGESEYLAPCLTGSYLAEKYGAPIYDTVGTRNGTGERNSSAGDGDWVQEGNFQFVTPSI